jgi:gas vesicle protein
MNTLARRDKQLRQISSHIHELNELLQNNSRDIHEKEKSNKYLSNLKNQFKEYEETMNNLKERQIESFNTLKQYLKTLEPSENIDDELNEIEREINKLNG